MRALDAARRDVTGRGYDGVLLVPAYFEAGRFTAGDIHYARVGDRDVPVGETEFARDATFGYTASDLREFVAEKSGGAIARRRRRTASASTTSASAGRAESPRSSRGVTGGAFVVVNATDYDDLEVVVLGLRRAEAAGPVLPAPQRAVVRARSGRAGRAGAH